MGTIVGSLFFQMDLNAFVSRFGYLFNSCMFLGLGSIAQLPNFMDNRDVFIKQRRAAFFPTSVFLLSLTVSTLPMAMLETTIYGSLGYWLAGLSDEISRYLVFLITLLMTNLSMTSFVRMIGCASRNVQAATPLAAALVILVVLYAGFMLTPDNIPWY